MEEAPVLAIGPLNVAGQAYQWSQAARGAGVNAFSFAGTVGRARRIDGPRHRWIPHHRVTPNRARQAYIRQVVLHQVSHLLSESLTPIVGNPKSDALRNELRYWRTRGVTVGAVFHGSDVRNPVLHMERLPHSFFRECDPQWTARLAQAAQTRRDQFRQTGLPGLVSTPDLMIDLPEATWLPVVVDAPMWVTGGVPLTNRRPRVLHRPSAVHPPIKGTAHIDPTLRRLHDRGVIEYVCPQRVSHSQMPLLVSGVDVVVDQIMTGSYGVAAVEGLAAGRVVIGYIDQEVRRAMPANPPIIDATPATFEEVVIEVVENRRDMQSAASMGPEFVSRFHNGKYSGAVLRRFVDRATG